MKKFVFDLDGTITKVETLPLIARAFAVEDKIDQLTAETVNGDIPFIESFIRRVEILKAIPVSRVAELLAAVELQSQVVKFIRDHADRCAIATGNLDCWINQLADKIGCQCFCSHASVEADRLQKIESIIKKENVVTQLKSQGNAVIFIGDGNNDVEAMRVADAAIASGIAHEPAHSVVEVADYIIYDESTLCQQLNQLL